MTANDTKEEERHTFEQIDITNEGRKTCAYSVIYTHIIKKSHTHAYFDYF